MRGKREQDRQDRYASTIAIASRIGPSLAIFKNLTKMVFAGE
jgi:hypothetical protein